MNDDNDNNIKLNLLHSLFTLSSRKSILPQSSLQLFESSPLLHIPSPHLIQDPQSDGQDEQLSPVLHIPSPHLNKSHEPDGLHWKFHVCTPLFITNPLVYV